MVANVPEQYENEINEFYFLKPSGIINKLPPIYTILVGGKTMKINIDDLSRDEIKIGNIQMEIRNTIGNNLISFIETFSLTELNKSKVKIKFKTKTIVPAVMPVAEPADAAEPVAEPEPAVVEPEPATAAIEPTAAAIEPAPPVVKKLKRKLKITQ